MLLSTFIQIIASCFGIIGSLFFAIGVIRQNADTMAKLSGTYFGGNRHIALSLAAQRADYIFGGAIIVLAFLSQLLSYLVPATAVFVGLPLATAVPWIAAAGTVVTFIVLHVVAGMVTQVFLRQINEASERQKQQRK